MLTEDAPQPLPTEERAGGVLEATPQNGCHLVIKPHDRTGLKRTRQVVLGHDRTDRDVEVRDSQLQTDALIERTFSPFR
jgi:hypothetical protein